MSQLDFGIPFLYAGNKKVVNGFKELEENAGIVDLILITQGFDDHAHSPTLRKLSKLNPNVPYICPPSAVDILLSC